MSVEPRPDHTVKAEPRWCNDDPQCALCGAALDAGNGYCLIDADSAQSRCWDCSSATERIDMRPARGTGLRFERQDAGELRLTAMARERRRMRNT